MARHLAAETSAAGALAAGAEASAAGEGAEASAAGAVTAAGGAEPLALLAMPIPTARPTTNKTTAAIKAKTTGWLSSSEFDMLFSPKIMPTL